MTKTSTSEFTMAKANERGHCNEAFKFESSLNNFELTVQNSPSQGQHQDRRDLKKKILKNLLLISVAFMVLFTSYESIAKLQSSINKARPSLKKVRVSYLRLKVFTHPEQVSSFEQNRLEQDRTQLKTIGLLHKISLGY